MSSIRKIFFFFHIALIIEKSANYESATAKGKKIAYICKP